MIAAILSVPRRRSWRALPLAAALVLVMPASAVPLSPVASLDLSLPRGEPERRPAPRPELLPSPPSEFAEWEKPKRPPLPGQPPTNLQSSPICGNGQHGIPYGPQERRLYRCD